MTSIYYTIPCGRAWLHKHCHFAACRILADGRYKIRHDCPTHTPYVDALHACMNDFLDHGEDFWLSHDDDNPPTKNPLDLVEHNLDVVGLPTPVWHSAVFGDRPFYYNAMDRVDDGYGPHEPSNELLDEVDAIGSGCFLVARRVMMAMKDQQPFMREWGSDGRVIRGGDFMFCEKAV